MKIEIEKKTNGIHDYLSLEITDPKMEDMDLLADITSRVEEYNKIQTDKA